MSFLTDAQITTLVTAYHDNHDYSEVDSVVKAKLFASAVRGLMNPAATPERLEKLGVSVYVDRKQLPLLLNEALSFIANEGQQTQQVDFLSFQNWR